MAQNISISVRCPPAPRAEIYPHDAERVERKPPVTHETPGATETPGFAAIGLRVPAEIAAIGPAKSARTHLVPHAPPHRAFPPPETPQSLPYDRHPPFRRGQACPRRHGSFSVPAGAHQVGSRDHRRAKPCWQRPHQPRSALTIRHRACAWQRGHWITVRRYGPDPACDIGSRGASIRRPVR
jgi:hypothetical protein